MKLKKRKKSEYSSLTLLNERISPAYEEAIKRLRIRVMHEAETEGSGVIMVTSSIPGEGKTTIAVNLAIAIARQGKSVILADCDPRNPSVAEVLPDGKEHPGIGAVLRGKAPFSEALTDSGIPDVDLKILYGGEPNSKDAALLGSRRMEKAIRAMEKQADYVILDTAPAELLADASLLGKYVTLSFTWSAVITQDEPDPGRHRDAFHAGRQYSGIYFQWRRQTEEQPVWLRV